MSTQAKNIPIGRTQALAKITNDHIGQSFQDKIIGLGDYQDNLIKKRFKLYDDDDELYYEGYFYDDEYCEPQMDLLDWAMNDSGCTKIKVAIGNGKFKFEIS